MFRDRELCDTVCWDSGWVEAMYTRWSPDVQLAGQLEVTVAGGRCGRGRVRWCTSWVSHSSGDTKGDVLERMAGG